MSYSRSVKDHNMQFSFVQNARSLDPVLMARFPEVSSQRFTKLADRHCALNKISANTADKSKNQYADLVNMARFEHKEMFLDLRMKSDRVDVFLIDLFSEKSHAYLLVVIKIICIISHGQSLTERGFSVNKEVNDCNMLEESLICQRVVYDALQACVKEKYEIEFDQELSKSCLLSYQKYKEAMKMKAVDVNTTDRDMKCKLKVDEIMTMKIQKMAIQCSIEALKEGI